MDVPPIVSKTEMKRRSDSQDKLKTTEMQNNSQFYTQNIHPKRAKVNIQKEKRANDQRGKSFAGIN
ncbi:MAG: hypothetical protein IKI39_01615 [Oscillospiraceae bacterium]|nr:hypothetical protein [Oscillospiraceae bacterium]